MSDYKWDISRVTGGYESVHTSTGSTCSYAFPENKSQENIVYEIKATDDKGCVATSSYEVKSDPSCNCTNAALTSWWKASCFDIGLINAADITGSYSVTISGTSADCDGNYIMPTITGGLSQVVPTRVGLSNEYTATINFNNISYSSRRKTITVSNSQGLSDTFEVAPPNITICANARVTSESSNDVVVEIRLALWSCGNEYENFSYRLPFNVEVHYGISGEIADTNPRQQYYRSRQINFAPGTTVMTERWYNQNNFDAPHDTIPNNHTNTNGQVEEIVINSSTDFDPGAQCMNTGVLDPM